MKRDAMMMRMRRITRIASFLTTRSRREDVVGVKRGGSGGVMRFVSTNVDFGHRTESVRMNELMNEDSTMRLKWNKVVRELKASERVEWASRTFPGHVAMSTSFGIHSSALLHLATRLVPDLPIIWVDTGYLPPETYQYAEEIQDALNLNLFVSTSAVTPARMEATYGRLWDNRDPESHQLYGRMRKVEPMRRSLRDLDVKCLMVALRADQTTHRASLEPLGVQHDCMKLLPILEWSKREVEAYMDDHRLPRHPLQARGYHSVGDWHSSRPVDENDASDRDGRFHGVSQECGLHTDDAAARDVALPPPPPPRQPSRPLGGQILDAYNLDGNDTHPTVLMVKKRMSDGKDCRRCVQVQEMIERDNFQHVGRTILAKEGDAESDGVKLSREFNMRTAPFFVVKMPGENEEFQAVESYLQLKKMLKPFDEKTRNGRECQIDFEYDGRHYTEGNCVSTTQGA